MSTFDEQPDTTGLSYLSSSMFDDETPTHEGPVVFDSNNLTAYPVTSSNNEISNVINNIGVNDGGDVGGGGGGINFGVTIVDPSLGGDGTGGVGDGTVPRNPMGTYGEERNWVVVGVLIALIVVLWIVLGLMLCIPLGRFVRRRMPVSKKRVNRRYETIEGWLITKVSEKSKKYLL